MSVYLHMNDPTISYDLTENKEVEGEKDIITEYNTLYCEHEKDLINLHMKKELQIYLKISPLLVQLQEQQHDEKES